MKQRLNKRLLVNVLESLQRFFKYDYNVNLQGQGSIREFFESIGGKEALNALMQHPNFNIYDNVSKILEQYFANVDNDDVDFLFS